MDFQMRSLFFLIIWNKIYTSILFAFRVSHYNSFFFFFPSPLLLSYSGQFGKAWYICWQWCNCSLCKKSSVECGDSSIECPFVADSWYWEKLRAGVTHCLSYGEHYDSVRRINDNSEAPAHLQTDFQILHQDESNKREKIKTKSIDFEGDQRDEVGDAVQKVYSATGCSDFNLIVQNLEAENYNIESAIIAMLQMNQGKRNNAEENVESSGRVLKPCGPLWEEGGSGAKLFGNQALSECRTENSQARTSPSEENKANKNQLQKVTNRQRREQQRLEKKKRQEERHRHKALESRSSHRDSNRSEADMNTQVTLVKTFAALNIWLSVFWAS